MTAEEFNKKREYGFTTKELLDIIEQLLRDIEKLNNNDTEI